ncbi:MAG: hypothetical protein MJ223_01605 [Mycoplasmoidaceae bacterium]|nr:hypothetical protein [Mycoplasmoidaceae bacterium]
MSEDLQKKIEVLSAKKGEIQVGSVPLLKLDPTKNVGHHVFVISATIAVTFFLILLTMILIRWFA